MTTTKAMEATRTQWYQFANRVIGVQLGSVAEDVVSKTIKVGDGSRKPRHWTRYSGLLDYESLPFDSRTVELNA